MSIDGSGMTFPAKLVGMDYHKSYPSDFSLLLSLLGSNIIFLDTELSQKEYIHYF